MIALSKWKNTNLIDKTGYSLNGLKSAFLSEKAVRNEFTALVVMVALAIARGRSAVTVLCVFVACLVPPTVEMINTAAEIIIDLLLGPIYREDVRLAKDMLSAAVFLSLVIAYTLSLKLIFF